MKVKIDDSIVRVTLSRRNLQTLINKLDRNATGGNSHCQLVRYTEAGVWLTVTAEEDPAHYNERPAGEVLDAPEEKAA